MVKLIIQDYNIVDKKENKMIAKTIKECKAIYNAWAVLSADAQKETEVILDSEITKKLEKCFSYYQRKYDVEIETGYGEMKDIEINLSNICEKIKSWEE